MMALVRESVISRHGIETNNFTSVTDHRRIIDTAYKAAELGRPYILILAGDGAFNSLKEFLADLQTHRAAFEQCAAIIFMPMPHTPEYIQDQVQAMFVEFTRSTSGAVYRLCRTAEDVNEFTSRQSRATAIPGYKTVLTPDGPVYVVPGLSRRVYAAALAAQPNVTSAVAATLLDLGRGAAVRLLTEDPVFSRLYGALKANRRHADPTVASEAVAFISSFSTIKGTVPKGSVQELALNALIDAADWDEELVDDLRGRLEASNGDSDDLWSLCSTQMVEGEALRLAKRDILSESLVFGPEARSVLFSLFTVPQGAQLPDQMPLGQQPRMEQHAVRGLFENVAPKPIVYARDRPESIRLALQLFLTLHGPPNPVSRRSLLCLALWTACDAPVALTVTQDGFDPSIPALFSLYLDEFRDQDVVGLRKQADGQTFVMDNMPEGNLAPPFMRWLLRAIPRYPKLAPCPKFVGLIRSLYRYFALLRITHDSSRAFTFVRHTRVVPPSSRGLAVTWENFRPIDAAAAASALQSRCPQQDLAAEKASNPARTIIGEHAVHPAFRPQVREILDARASGDGAILPEMVSVGLIIHEDNSVAVAAPYELVTIDTLTALQPAPSEMSAEEGIVDWKAYFERLVRHRVLLRLLRQQLRGLFGKHELPPVIDAVRNTVGAAVPVSVECPAALRPAILAAYPDRVVTPQTAVEAFTMRSGAAVTVEATIDIEVPWRTLFAIPLVSDSLGVPPAVAAMLMGENGTKLTYARALELLPLFQAGFDAPPREGTEVLLPLQRRNYQTSVPGRTKALSDLRFVIGDKEHRAMRREFTQMLERILRVSVTLPDRAECAGVDTEAMCFICCSTFRVSDPNRWFRRHCCEQALCVDCAEHCTRVEEAGSRLVHLRPACPYCRVPIAPQLLNTLPPRLIDAHAARYDGRGNHLLLLVSNLDGMTPEEMRDSEGTLFCRCDNAPDCPTVIPFNPECGADANDLPTKCSHCASTLSSDIFVRHCDPTKGGCGAVMSRAGGCNNVQCICGINYCWLCGEQLECPHDPYHFIHGYFSDRCISGTFHLAKDPEDEHSDEYSY
jgi:hypothetical protein